MQLVGEGGKITQDNSCFAVLSKVREPMQISPYQGQQNYSMIESGTTDEGFIALWLKNDKSQSTQAEYRRDIDTFRSFHDGPLSEIKLNHIYEYITELSLLNLGINTIARRIKSLKSLLSFGQRTGYLIFNVGSMVKVPKSKNELAQRILTEEEVIRMITLETHKRNHALLRFLYNSACRVSEACDLKWKDVSPTGVVTLFGKGNKTRYVKLKPEVYQEMHALYKKQGFVFVSQKGGKLDASQVLRIVKAAALRAGINTEERPVSPHWFRHSHASHALARGVSIAIIQATLGHESIDTTMGYIHISPEESSGLKLVI